MRIPDDSFQLGPRFVIGEDGHGSASLQTLSHMFILVQTLTLASLEHLVLTFSYMPHKSREAGSWISLGVPGGHGLRPGLALAGMVAVHDGRLVLKCLRQLLVELLGLLVVSLVDVLGLLHSLLGEQLIHFALCHRFLSLVVGPGGCAVVVLSLRSLLLFFHGIR